MTQNTIKPLKKLQKGVRLISQGVMPVDLHINTRDEIQELGEEVHTMSLTLQKQRERIQALFDASQAISANLELEEVLQLIVERAYLLVEAKVGALIYRFSREGEQPGFIFRMAGLRPDDCQIGQSPPFTGLHTAIIKMGKPLRLGDYKQHPGTKPTPSSHFPVGAFLGAPIIIRGEGIGQVYTVREPGAPPFTTQDEDILVTFAHQAAIAIQNAENYQEVQNRVEKFRALEKIGDAMLSSLSLDSILKEGLEMIMKLAKTGKGAMILKGGQDGWKVRLAQGLSEELVSTLEMSVAEGSRGVSVLQGKIYTSEWPGLSEEGIRVRISVPLRGKGGVIGVIDLFSASSARFSKETLETLQVATDQIAMGIENTRLYHEVQKRLRQAQIFRDFSEVAMMMSTEEELLNAAVRSAEKLFPCDYGIIFLYESSTDSLHPAATWGSEARAPEYTEPCEEAAKRCMALRRGRLFSVRDSSKGLSCPYHHLLLGGEERSYLCAPMMALGNIIGLFHLVWRQPEAFAADKETILSQFADQVARYGGEEFVIMLPDTDPEGARRVGEKLRETLSELKIKSDTGVDLSISVSIGGATFPEHGTSAPEIVKAADIALYKSKGEGRNRLTLYGN